MNAQVVNPDAQVSDTSVKNTKSHPKQKLTYEEMLAKRKRRERRENSAMMKLFISALVVVALIVIVAIFSKYF